MSILTIRINDRKCATCRWRNGPRRIKFSGNKPYYVEITCGNYLCDTYSNRTSTPGNGCAWYQS